MKFWEEVQERERERIKRERENDLSARWQPSGGRKKEVVPVFEP